MHPSRPPRLPQVWISRPVFFVTSVTDHRAKILANPASARVLINAWQASLRLYGWAVGEFVIMPDHVHFFCREAREGACSLSDFVGRWKRYTAGKVSQDTKGKVWQPGFFDRLLRAETEWEEKRLYMLENPVRALLVSTSEAWPYQGDLDMFREE